MEHLKKRKRINKMFVLPRFSGEDNNEDEEDMKIKLYQDLAAKQSELLKDKHGNLLIQVKIKGTGHGFYWSFKKRTCFCTKRC